MSQMIQNQMQFVAMKTKFKLIFLGDQHTGKTSIIQRFIHQRFNYRSNPTIGIDFLGKNITHKGKQYRLQLWDTAGQEKFRSLIPSYLKDALCVVYVFDVNNAESLEGMERWVQLFRENSGPNTVAVLCGNKGDLQKSYDKETFRKFVEGNRTPYFEVSALTGEGINGMFTSIVDLINEELSRLRMKTDKTEIQIDLPPLTKEPLVELKNQKEGQEKKKRMCC